MRTANTLIRLSDWADAQADLCLCWTHRPLCCCCHALALFEPGVRKIGIPGFGSLNLYLAGGFPSSYILTQYTARGTSS